MGLDGLITRDEALAGLPARRASTLLYLIENRVALMASEATQVMARYRDSGLEHDRYLDYLEAFALSAPPPRRPTIQQLEHYAPRWAYLVPENPDQRAVLAHLLAERHAFTRALIPGIALALGLDDQAVQERYQRRYDRPLSEIYAARLSPGAWLAWLWAGLTNRLNSLPPFWMAFAMTLTETVGAGTLALPIALAGVGPLAGVILLVVLGAVNMLTAGALAETVSRNGGVRYSGAFFGQVVSEYLGRAGSVVLSISIFALIFFVLQSYYVGLSTTLAAVTPIPAWAWVAVTFAIGLYFVSRESLNSTIASAMLIGAINIGLIALLAGLAFTQMQPANLAYIRLPFVGGRSFDPSVLKLVFGVVIAAYFGHLTVGTSARVVLRRDPDGRSLVLGTMAAQATAIVLYCLWVTAISGAVAPQALSAESGTALAPLAARIGPGVNLLGVLYVALAMGMASIHYVIALYNLVRERLPRQVDPVVLLPRGRGRLILHPRGLLHAPVVTLAYTGLAGQAAQFRLAASLGGKTFGYKVAISGEWSSDRWLDEDEALRRHKGRLAFKLAVQAAMPEAARVQIVTPMGLRYEGDWDASGLSLDTLFELPDDLRRASAWIARQGPVSAAELAAHLQVDEAAALGVLTALRERSLVTADSTGGEIRFATNFAARPGSKTGAELWNRVAGPGVSSPGVVRRGRFGWLSQPLRLALGVSPAALAFALTERAILSNTQSFIGPMNLIGAIIVPLLAGIFPVLLLAASRRRGEIAPGFVMRFLGHPLTLGLIYLLFVTALVLHGLVIAVDPTERMLALVSAVVVVGLTITTAVRGSFRPRAFIGLADDRSQPDGAAAYSVVVAGQPQPAAACAEVGGQARQLNGPSAEIPDFEHLRTLALDFSAGAARELKVWAYRIGLTGSAEGLPVEVTLNADGAARTFSAEDGQAAVPLSGGAVQARIGLRGD